MTTAILTGQDPARALSDAALEGGSGVLTKVRGKQRRLVCLVDGALAHVASNAIEEQVEEFLARAGLLAGPWRAALEAEARDAGRAVAALLAERPGIHRPALERVIVERDRELFLSTLDTRDGEFRFERGIPDLTAQLVVPQPCLPLLFQHALRPVRPIEEVRMRIGPPGLRLVRSAEVESRLAGVELSPTALELLATCDGARPVSEIVARDPGAEAATLRIVYGLLLVGAIEPAGARAGRRRERADAVTRDEVAARVGRAAGADHYDVLGLKADAPGDAIRASYYFLARRYHPDRFRSGDLQDMLADIERYFSQVTEAYNTLTDAELRRLYDEDLAARAAGTKKDTPQDTTHLAKQNYARGRQLAERRQYTEAVRSLENAILLDPSKAVYHLELGRVLALHPLRGDAAEAAMKKAIEIDPARVDAYLALGELYRRAERLEDAVRMVREALRWDPDHAGAQAALAELDPGKHA
jgi:curved DNA-binding protein CbpA